MTLPYTQLQRPVSRFAIATLVLGITGIVLQAAICGIVALDQIRPRPSTPGPSVHTGRVRNPV